MEKRASIAVGSGVQDDFSGSTDPALFVDTTPTVEEKRSTLVKPYRLSRPPGRELPPDVPPAYVSEHGDGCGLNSANGYAAARCSDGLKRAIENHVAEADVIFVNVSPNGGTGNGTWPVITELFKAMAFQDKRVYWLHHLVLANRQKVYTRLSDLRRKPPVGIHVLVKQTETARAILGLTRAESDAIEEVVKNIKAVHGNGSFEMINILDVSEETFVSDMVADVVLEAAELWNKGMRSINGQDVERIRNTVRHSLQEYQRPSDETVGRISAVLGGYRSEADVARAGELHIRSRRVAVLRDADQTLTGITDCVLSCGMEKVSDILSESQNRLQSEHQELSRGVAQQSGHDLIRHYVLSQRSWVNRVIHKLGLNGKAERGLASYLTREFRRTVKRELSTALGGLLDRFPNGVSSSVPHYRMPADSRIKRELAELYLRQSDPATGEQVLRTQIGNRLTEILLESIPVSARADLAYDYNIPEDVRDTEGLVVFSEHDLNKLPGLLHITSGHSRYHRSGKFLRLIAFVVVKDLLFIPELAQIIRREQTRDPLDPDTIKDRVRSDREMFLPPFVFAREEKEDAARMFLAQGFFTPDRLEVFKKGYVITTIDGQRSRYNSIQQLMDQLNDENRFAVHNGFWEFVASDPRRALTELENSALDRLTGEPAERRKAIREFSGITSWDSSVSLLVKEVQAAVNARNRA